MFATQQEVNVEKTTSLCHVTKLFGSQTSSQQNLCGTTCWQFYVVQNRLISTSPYPKNKRSIWNEQPSLVMSPNVTAYYMHFCSRYSSAFGERCHFPESEQDKRNARRQNFCIFLGSHCGRKESENAINPFGCVGRN